MRFGTYSLPISHDPAEDSEVIDRTLREIILAEELGFDAAWLTEHHFDGAVAYADPLVFATAVATRTKQIRIGFSVIQMALHHPVRLAVQTALLDNLSKGRLTVGIGRGSAYNAYEYIGFGVTIEQGKEMLTEAEDLLVKAWMGGPVEHRGKFWQVSFPGLRPGPYQKPHPPIARACLSEPSVVEMAKLGRPVLIGIQTLEAVAYSLKLYQETMASSGFDEAAVEKTLDQIWVQKHLYVAKSDEEAQEEATVAFDRQWNHIQEAREKYMPASASPALSGHPEESGRGNRAAQTTTHGMEPSASVTSTGVQTKAPSISQEHAYILGTPQRVAEQIAELRDAGVRNLLLQVDTGGLAFERASRTMHLFQEKVAPLFRS